MKAFIALAIALSLLLMSTVALAAAEDFRVRWGDREQNRIAITIDDCYNIDHVREALELSEQYDVAFTFFVLGVNIKEEDAELWRAVAESRCEIGNHTYSHKSLTDLDNIEIYKQLMRMQEALDAVLGYHYPVQVMRPPYGNLNRDGVNHVNKAIRAVGYDHAILWDIDSTDPEQCYRNVKNGSILLFHTNAKDMRCIETLLPQLIADGYELVTVSELLGMDPVVPSDEIYTYVNYYDWREQNR